MTDAAGTTAGTMRTERLALVHRLRGLRDADWDRPSLCAGWTVRHVVAHLATPYAVSATSMGLLVLRHRRPDRAMDAAAKQLADQRSPHDLLDLIEHNADSTSRPPGLPLAAPLVDAVAHSADVRWALSDDRRDTGDPTRLRPALAFVVSRRAAVGFLPAKRIQNLALVAEDAAWRHGAGADVRGPALSLLLAVLGRRPALQDLDGAGVALLDERTRTAGSRP